MSPRTRHCLLLWFSILILAVLLPAGLRYFEQRIHLPTQALSVSGLHPVPQVGFVVKASRWAEQPPLRYRY